MGASKKTVSAAKLVEKKDKPAPLPAWPALEPLGPREDLFLHDQLKDQIITVSGFFTAALCKKYVNFLQTLPLTTTSGIPKRGEAVRVNDRFQVEDANFADLLWSETGLRELLLGMTETVCHAAIANVELGRWGGDVVGLNPNIRIYRYRKGQYFDQHYDDSNDITIPGDPQTSAKTTWTILLYLTSETSGCKGGETVFYPKPVSAGKKQRKNQKMPEPIVVSPETGMLLLHRHGEDCLVHEGREVFEGEKWLIRTDLCVKR